MPSVSIARFETEIIKNYKAKRRAPKTVSQIKQVLRELRAVGVKHTSQVTDSAIADWIEAWPERSPETFRSHLRCLSAICTRLKKHGYVRLDPFEVDGVADWMRLDSRPSAPKRRWSKPADQVRRVLALADEEAAAGEWIAERDRAYAYTLFLTGGRPGEIQRLQISDFNRDERTLTIRAHWITGRAGRRFWWKPKTVGSAATMPIGNHLVGILDPWSRRVAYGSRRGRLLFHGCVDLFPGVRLFGPWTGGGPGESPLDRIKALGERAGVRDLTNKAARKGLGTYRGIELTPQGRRDYMRHADVATGDLYDEQTVEERRGDALKIERFFIGAQA